MEWARARHPKHNEALFFSNFPTDMFKKLEAVEATCLDKIGDDDVALQPYCCRYDMSQRIAIAIRNQCNLVLCQ